MSTYAPGRHFLQIPGPTNLPERVARALSRATVDHRGPDFAKLTLSILERLQLVFQTSGPVIIYPSSGSGAWEAALVNTLSPGDRVLFGANGQFAANWQKVAAGLGLTVEQLAGDWRCPVDIAALESRLAADGAARSARWPWSTTRHRPVSSTMWRARAPRWTGPVTARCCWLM